MRPSWDTLVVGAGPVGMLTALAAARRGRTALVTRTGDIRGQRGTPRLDAVPASFLALLLEFGVHPAVLGVHDLHDARLVAWEGAGPEPTRGPAMAHIEREALERALAMQVCRTRAIEQITLPAFPARSVAGLVIDATGRRAASARSRVQPAEPLVARSFWVPGRFSPGAQAFRIAALPDGYVYRLGSGSRILLGVVGPKAASRQPAVAVEQRMRVAGAGWLLAGLPSLGTFGPGRSGLASAQWSEGDDSAIRVGDADLARDALASQGLSLGVSDALNLVLGSAGEPWQQRRRDQRSKHLAALITLIGRCRFASAPFWSNYRAFLHEAAELG